MAIKLGRLRRNRPIKTTLVTGQPPPVSHFDRVLIWVANASQLGLLLLAVFGYFYTVVPVYQKSLLDEEIAKKNLELNAKDSELRLKATELAELNASLTNAREAARRAQIQVGTLKETVHEQYGELWPRLIREFLVLGSNSCNLGSIPDGSFATCIREKVLPSANLAGLRAGDRRLLQSIVDRDNDDIYKSWHKFVNALLVRRSDAETQKKEFDRKCAQMRASESYKDKLEKNSIDYQCSSDAIRSTVELSQIDLEREFKGREILASHLDSIVRDFLWRHMLPERHILQSMGFSNHL